MIPRVLFSEILKTISLFNIFHFFSNLEFWNHFSVVRELGSSRSEQERTGSEFEEDLGKFLEFSQKHILRKKITNSFI